MPFQWNKITTFTPASKTITAPWLVAVEDFDIATHLKIEATGSWTVGGGMLPACEPDGLSGLTLPAGQLVLEGCRYGALLGKLGGSSALHHLPADDEAFGADQPFPIGVYCVVKIPENATPLFIGFNTLSRPINIVDLSVTVSGAHIAT